MKATNLGTYAPYIRNVAVIVGAILLFDRAGPLFRQTGLDLQYLVWPLVAGAALGLLGVAISRFSEEQVLGRFLSPFALSETARERLSASLQIIRRTLTDSAWFILLMGALLAIPRIPDTVSGGYEHIDADRLRAYLQVFGNLANWAAWLVIPFIVARAAAGSMPAVDRTIGFPTVRLASLGAAFVLFSREGILITAYGFDGSTILSMAVAAQGLLYLAAMLGRLEASLGPWKATNAVHSAALLGGTKSIAVLCMSLAGAGLVWAILDTLPSVNAILLDSRDTSGLGETSAFYFSQLFDTSRLIAGLALALGLTVGAPGALRAADLERYVPLAGSIGYASTGCLFWLVAADLSPIGHVYPLIGAIAASGFFSLSLARLARYVTTSPNSALSGFAEWLSRSTSRGFFLGAGIAFYGLFLRPVLYDSLWFAPIFEWLAVVVVALVSLGHLRNRINRKVESATTQPAIWTGWARHEQSIEAIPDRQVESILSRHRRFIDEGDWRPIWAYLLELMLRNEAPLDAVKTAFGPLRRLSLESASPRLWNWRPARTRESREAVLEATLRAVDEILSLDPIPLGEIEEDDLKRTGEPFTRSGTAPDSLAATAVAAYWQRGASLSQALQLWFPLVTFLDASPRWFDTQRTRRRLELDGLKRRRRLVDGMISHLFRRGDQHGLYVAILAKEATVFSQPVSRQHNRVARTLNRGRVVEILAESASSYLVRATDGTRGHLAKQQLVRQPILPTDVRA